jgi:hypothetical protein
VVGPATQIGKHRTAKQPISGLPCFGCWLVLERNPLAAFERVFCSAGPTRDVFLAAICY